MGSRQDEIATQSRGVAEEVMRSCRILDLL